MLNFEIDPIFAIFHGQALKRLETAVSEKRRFAYYTTAGTAAEVLKRREIWLRLPACMNDFSETEHGLRLLEAALDRPAGKKLLQALAELRPGLEGTLLPFIQGMEPRRLFASTFIACVSEYGHDASEEQFGRLSMWRAYGGTSGVAFVFNNSPFNSDDSDLGAYSSAVEYLGPEGFDGLIGDLADRIKAGAATLVSVDDEELVGYLHHAALLAALCVKHEAFAEEREWRIFNANAPLGRLKRSIETIDCVPQPVLKMPIDELPSILEKIVVGPTDYPLAVGQAMLDLMIEAGVSDAASKLVISGVPLRLQPRR